MKEWLTTWKVQLKSNLPKKKVKSLSLGNFWYFEDIRWIHKIVKCPLEWWRKYKFMFPIVVFFIWQILKIIGLQIEIEKIFSPISIQINLRKCWLQANNFQKLVFVNGNWPNDMTSSCKVLSTLVGLLKSDLELQNEF